MWSKPATPVLSMLATLIVGVVAAGAALVFSLQTPWLGLTLRADEAGVQIVAIDRDGPSQAVPAPARLLSLQGMPLSPSDLVEEPDYLPDYAQTAAFISRQSELTRSLERSPVSLEVRDAAGHTHIVQVTPVQRPLRDLPALFWIQVAFGIGGLLIGAWVWALRPSDWGARMFALSGLGMLLFSSSAAVYSTREIALDGAVFRLLAGLNHGGALLFGAAMIAMFLNYPRRLVPPIYMLLLLIVFGPWLVIDQLRLVPSALEGASGAVMVQMTLIVAAIGAQWWATRRSPVDRAALGWLGLSVVLGAGCFVLVWIAPQAAGIPPFAPQGYGFGLFFLIYAGIALGLRRYRLFDLGEWAFRIMFYTVGGLVLLAMDAVLIYVLGFGRTSSFAVALLGVTFLYLPLRNVLWRATLARKLATPEEMFHLVVESALAPTAQERSERWRVALQRLFDPLEIRPAAPAPSAPEIRDNGLEMVLPTTAESPALSLRYPWGGGGLFGPAHLRLARRAVSLLVQTETSRQAYERGAVEERTRIARDLHDDVGALLLSGLHKPDLEETRRSLRDAITDIRTVAGGLAGERRPLGDVLADLRHETAERLEHSPLQLDWAIADQDDDQLLDYRLYKNLKSAVREVVSNAIRHAQATTLTVQAERAGDRLVLTIEDDGVGLPSEAPSRGLGLSGMRRRLEDIGGSAEFPTVQRGVRVVLTLDLSPQAALAPA